MRAFAAMAFYLVQGAWDHVDNTHMVFNKAESRLAMPWSRRGAASAPPLCKGRAGAPYCRGLCTL